MSGVESIRKEHQLNELVLESKLTFILAGISPQMRDGVAVVNREGQPMMNVSCIVPPTKEGGKFETIEVRVPAAGIAKQIPPYSQVRFENLTARMWAIETRSGLSFSAVSVKMLTASAAS